MEGDRRSSFISLAYEEYEREPMDDYYESRLAGVVSRMRLRKILSLVGEKEKNVLDIGCEAGYVSIRLAERGHRLTGLDLCKPALKKFRNRDKPEGVAVVAGIAQHLPFSDSKFDCVILSEVIEHTPDVGQILREISRVLKDGGMVVLTFPNESLRRPFYPLVKMLGIDSDAEKDVTLYEHDLESVKNEVASVFRIDKTSHLPSILYPMTYVIVASNLSKAQSNC